MGFPAISQRALQTPPSPIRKLSHLAARAKSLGRKVYHLNIGQPDIGSPPEFFEGLRRYTQSVVAYEDSQGNRELCRAWSSSINQSLDVGTSPENFLITTGASEALVFIFMILSDPGDEVIIFDPTYANYIGFAAIAGVKLVPVKCLLEENFNLPDASVIEAKITPRTKAILLCSPNNPTGSVYNRAQLESLVKVCDERKLFLVVDETYREFVYDQLKPLSLLQVAPNNPRVIIVDSLSKRFSLCGARIGCLITSNEEILAAGLNLAQARLCSPTIEQFAAAHMLNSMKGSLIDQVRREYEHRRNVLLDCLTSIPGIVAQKPGGAFYMVARLPVKNAEDFAAFMLKDYAQNGATTFVAPATGFYMENGRGINKIRLAYVLNDGDIVNAIGVLEAGLNHYISRGA